MAANVGRLWYKANKIGTLAELNIYIYIHVHVHTSSVPCACMQQLKEQLPVREAEAQKLVDLGNEILQDVDTGSVAEKHVDTRLSETTERWYRLVGRLDTQESGVNKVLINWKAYVNMRHSVQTFISRMGGMVGSEPLESSNGDNTLLPQYRVSEVTSCHIVCNVHVHTVSPKCR